QSKSLPASSTPSTALLRRNITRTNQTGATPKTWKKITYLTDSLLESVSYFFELGRRQPRLLRPARRSRQLYQRGPQLGEELQTLEQELLAARLWLPMLCPVRWIRRILGTHHEILRQRSALLC